MCLSIGFFELLTGISKILSVGISIAAFVDIFAVHFYRKLFDKVQIILSGNTK